MHTTRAEYKGICRTEDPAAAFRARGSPAIMRLHAIMDMEQNRQLGVCSLNDFRKVGVRPQRFMFEMS